MLDDNNKGSESADFLSGQLKAVESSLKKVGEALQKNFSASEIAKTIIEMDDRAVSIVKSFGQTRENIVGIKQAMGDAVVSVAALGGKFSDIAELQESVAKTLGRNVVVMSESYEKLYATTKVTGIGAETLVKNFKDAGISAYQASGEMEKVVNVARESGVNAQAVSNQVVANMASMNQFNFKGGVEGMAKMAAQAVSLRVDMQSTLKIADELFSPDKAIEMAASLQRLGVANSELLDPLRLMDMAQNDPAELQNQIAKMSEQFVQLNEKGQFEILPGAKRQLMEVEKAMGLPSGQLSKMALGAAETAEKMKQIKFPEGAFTEEQKGLIASMAEMGPGGEFKISLGGESLGLDEAITKLQKDPEQLKVLQEMAQPKTMEEMAKGQLTNLEDINANIATLVKTPYAIGGTKIATQALEAPRILTRGVADTFGGEKLSTKNIRQGFGEGSEQVMESINKLIKGEGSFSEVLSVAKDSVEKTGKFMGEAFTESVDRGKTAIDRMTESGNLFVEMVINGTKKFGTAFMEHEKLTTPTVPVKDSLVTINPLPEDSFLTMTKGKEFMANMASAANNGGNQNMTPVDNGPININLNISAPPNIDTAQLIQAFETVGVKQAIVDAATKGRYNRDVPTSNPQQLMEMSRNYA